MPTYQVYRFNNGSHAGPFYDNTATPSMLNRNGSIDLTSVVNDATFAEYLTNRMPYLQSDLYNFYVGTTGNPTRLLEFRAVDWGMSATGNYECDALDIGLDISYDGGNNYSSIYSGSISGQDTTGQGMMVFYILADESDKIRVNVNIDNDTSANPLINCIMMDLDHKWKIMDTSYMAEGNTNITNKDLLHRWRVRGSTAVQTDLINYFGMWSDIFPNDTTVDKSFDVGV